MAAKHTHLTDKKKPNATISPQKKDKLAKHAKIEKIAKDLHSRSVSQTRMKSYIYFFSVILMALGFGCLHMFHVSTLFENDRHFSHLSDLEREMTFRTEMGLYYSFFKTMIEASSFSDGMLQILNDNTTEYPSVINTLKRFNLYPEVIIGASYRFYTSLMAWLEIPAKQCWQVERGDGLAPVLSCEGLGDPMYFYLQAVWICAGLTAAVVFLYGVFIRIVATAATALQITAFEMSWTGQKNRSVCGGFIAIGCFFFNHGESTRVQWTPPLRESFAYPFLLLQMLFVCMMLRHKEFSWRRGLGVAVTTTISLVTWQFSQFVLATQVAALLAIFALGVTKKHTLLLILLFLAAGVQHGLLLLLGNVLLASSFLVSLLASCIISAFIIEPTLNFLSPIPKMIVMLSLTGIKTHVIRSKLLFVFGTTDDAHIWNLLGAKLGSYRDFHTMLYTCSVEFDFLPMTYVHKISATLLLPAVCIVLLAVSGHVLYHMFTQQQTPTPPQNKQSKQDKSKPQVAVLPESSSSILTLDIEPELLYTLLQLGVFVLMTGLVMRLKLFLTPQLCIIAAVLASRKYFQVIRSSGVHWAILAVIVSGMSVNGIQNISEQRNIIGEYSNVGLEQLLEWVKAETPQDAVFAGPMPVMANLLLSTRRPIVNHPHYEDADLRERTKKVYTVFSRHTAQEVYKTLSQMQVQFLVLEESWCFRESRPGCSMTDIWDIVEPEMRSQPPLCPRLFLQNPSPFERVFSNNEYVVLWLHSQYVELKSVREYKQ